MATDTNHAIENAQAWLENIVAMVKRLEHAQECDGDEDCEIALEVIRDGVNIYYTPGQPATEEQNEQDRRDYHDSDAALEAITESPLSVEVRSGWYNPYEGSSSTSNGAAEYKILLTTGGPALRIIGELNQYGEPETARLEWQDWGTQWTEYACTDGYEGATDILTYARQFYYGS